MSLWRKRNVQHNGQNQPKWFNMTALANNDLSIKSDDLSIKSEEAMREVQRLGQEIEQEPVAWYRDENGIRIYYETKVWDDCTPLYTTPQQPTWTGLTDEDDIDWEEGDNLRNLVKAIEAKLKEKNT
jgi:hypothetical protein